ncbi:MazG-like family protein [Jiella pelagia]|uniref:MazG-like family protein n=1 Tax=Jiella pelagia TaxID=2986949 RepID=A0ABY7BUF2_9HYPH|nr:MazG-like family protein [Jiella pelagia]WAP67203.1 MazG-like family protein [Jiella pelagia]
MSRSFTAVLNDIAGFPTVSVSDGSAVGSVCIAETPEWAETIARALNSAEGDRRAIAAELAEAMNAEASISPHVGEMPGRAEGGAQGATVPGILSADGMSTTVTYQTLRKANLARQALWCPEQVPDLSFRGNELAGETGEACNVIKKLERERHGWRGSRATTAELASELADVVICADLCAISGGIDLDEAVEAKFNATSDKVGLPVRYTRAAKAPAWNPPLEWRWYHAPSEDGEAFFGECATREEAIAVARGDLHWLDAEDDGTGRWVASFHIVEAAREPLRLSRYVVVDSILEQAEERSSEDEERVGECDAEAAFFAATPQQEADLAARIEQVCDAWQAEHGIFYRPYVFSHTRNGETVTVDITEERAAALAAAEAAQAAGPLGSAPSATSEASELKDGPLPGLAGEKE